MSNYNELTQQPMTDAEIADYKADYKARRRLELLEVAMRIEPGATPAMLMSLAGLIEEWSEGKLVSREQLELQAREMFPGS